MARSCILLGDVADLFEQRQVEVAFDVALRARIAVPVPGAAEVAAVLDHADALEAGFAQARRGQQPAEAAADDGDSTSSISGARVNRLDIGVVDVVAELGLHLDVLRVAVGAQALVALGAVLLVQGVGIEVEGLAHGPLPGFLRVS